MCIVASKSSPPVSINDMPTLRIGSSSEMIYKVKSVALRFFAPSLMSDCAAAWRATSSSGQPGRLLCRQRLARGSFRSPMGLIADGPDSRWTCHRRPDPSRRTAPIGNSNSFSPGCSRALR